MNFGLMISCRVEEKLLLINRPDDWSQADEALAYERCLKEVLDESQIAWADGNIRIGDYILLIDSDTRVPSDCLLDAASEMEQSPDVGIMQFTSGVMQVVNTYFENGITFFTNLIYSAIKYTVSNGDVAPFVGHNAILRWAAIQQVSYTDEDNYEKFWSESHVSEDFDMSLRLQCNGFIIRLAGWAGEGFKEGVSLTVYDELARWEKYAYGCNELLFHPIRTWLWKGPFTPLFRRFLFSNIRFTSKITIISYIGTYYAIGAAWIMTTANYLAIGWFNGYLDKYYIDSWQVWFSIVIVFNGLGNVALAAMRYRDDKGGFFANCKILLPSLTSACTDSVLSVDELQVDLHALYLLGRSLPPCITGLARAHVRNRHDVGCDVQGSRILQLLHRSAQGAEEVQIQHVLRLGRHRRNDCPCDRQLHSSGLANQGFRRHPPHGDRHVKSHASANSTEPCAHDILLVIHHTLAHLSSAFDNHSSVILHSLAYTINGVLGIPWVIDINELSFSHRDTKCDPAFYYS